MGSYKLLAPLLVCAAAFGQNGALRVSDPAPSKDGTVFTSEPAVVLKGTLRWTGGDRRVRWKSNRGFADLAIVTVSGDGQTIEWTSSVPVPLRPGVNHVEISAPGQPGAATFLNIYYTGAAASPANPLRTAVINGRRMAYEVVGGRAVYQNDIVLGPTAEVARGRVRGRLAPHPQAATIVPSYQSDTGLWPVVNGVARVPYAATIVNSANIASAIAESNAQLSGVLQWVPATDSDINMVQFDFTLGDESGTCESNVGMAGGTQIIGGAENCGVGTILHEMGHAIGLFHEQSRTDRNTYVNYLESNVDKPQSLNFDIYSSGADSGLFNYASLMEYGAFSFSRDGLSPTLESIPAGIPLGSDTSQYTTGDLDGIMRLYGHPPSSITVDSNPTGLQLKVDGVLCTAPCVFSTWTIGSPHTLDAPLDAHSQTLQILSGQPYLFGRWNAGAANQTPVTVTISAGNGTLLSPTTSPAITNYLANFIPIHPYSPVVAPSSGGTITSSPPPSTMIINGVSTHYYLDRQQVTITVHPNSGYNFLQWYNLPAFNFYQNPYSLYVTSNFDYYNSDPSYPVEAAMTTGPVLTIASASPDIGAGGSFGGLAVGIVDGATVTTAYTPQNFDASAFSQHVTLCASYLNDTTCPSTPVGQSPVTTNINYLFANWTGAASAGTDALAITLPSSGQATYTANYTPSFRTIVMPSIYCNGETSVTSSSTGVNSMGSDGNLDAFFNSGTIDFTANTGASGINFLKWSQDLSGSTNPLSYDLTNEVIGTANFNVPSTTAPLSITGVLSGLTTLTVTGTGFTTDPAVTNVYFGPAGMTLRSRPATLTSSTQLTVQLNGGDIAAPGYYQIAVQNIAPSGCSPSAFYNFPIPNSAGPPAWTVAKWHVGDFAQGQNGAPYTVLVTNSGTGPSVGRVTITEAAPSGETLVAMSGTGWDCSTSHTCVRTDSLAAGQSYPAITVTVNVSPGADSPQVNSVTVSGGAAASATATDSTTLHAEVAVPNVMGLTQGAAATSIQNQGLAVGTVALQSSNTVASGSVISESPSAGTMVDYGSVVNLVVSTGASTATLQSIAVTPANSSIAKGLTQQFAATGTYSDNSTQDLTSTVTWSSTNTAISAGGLATGNNTGTSTIRATSGAIQGSTVLTVTAAVLQSIAVTPANASIAKGLTQQFAATGTYSDNSTQDLTSSVTWSSTNTAISAGGLATGNNTGTSTIRATSGAIQGSTTLTVLALPPCDLDQDGSFKSTDVRNIISQALGVSRALNDLNGGGVNVIDVQIVLNAAAGLGCNTQ